MTGEAPKAEEVTVEPSPPKIEFVNADKRSITVPLDWPFTIDGVLVDRVEVRRCSTQEISECIQKMARGEPTIPPGLSCTLEQWNAMDDDDMMKVDEAAKPFIPRRLRKLMDAIDAQASNDGGNTSD